MFKNFKFLKWTYCTRKSNILPFSCSFTLKLLKSDIMSVKTTINFNYFIISYFFFFFFPFRPFPLVRGGHSVSFSTSFCLQCPSPSHQLPSYLLSHLKIFSLVSLFSSFLVTPFPSSFFLYTLGLSS